jgi:hypothetical protein
VSCVGSCVVLCCVVLCCVVLCLTCCFALPCCALLCLAFDTSQSHTHSTVIRSYSHTVLWGVAVLFNCLTFTQVCSTQMNFCHATACVHVSPTPGNAYVLGCRSPTFREHSEQKLFQYQHPFSDVHALIRSFFFGQHDRPFSTASRSRWYAARKTKAIDNQAA